MSEIIQLLPCPFCGKPPIVCEDDSYGDCFVMCHCEHEPSIHYSKEELPDAKRAWNRRAPVKAEGQ